MKNILLYILGFVLINLCFTSCEDTDYLQYDLNQKNGIYVEYFESIDSKEALDSIFYNFGFEDIEEYVIEVPVKLSGNLSGTDKQINIVIDNSKYANADVIAAKTEYFEIPESVILEKNATTAIIPVKLFRHSDLEQDRAVITFELIGNDNFEVRGQAEFTITFDDKEPVQPDWWLTFRWGEWNKLKGQLFFKYFWEMEQENKGIYDRIVARYGRLWNEASTKWGNSPWWNFPVSLKSVWQKVYDYSEEHPELEWNIMDPN